MQIDPLNIECNVPVGQEAVRDVQNNILAYEMARNDRILAMERDWWK